jgi:hypothetical protein
MRLSSWLKSLIAADERDVEVWVTKTVFILRLVSIGAMLRLN